jgi:hypothetical protein
VADEKGEQLLQVAKASLIDLGLAKDTQRLSDQLVFLQLSFCLSQPLFVRKRLFRNALYIFLEEKFGNGTVLTAEDLSDCVGCGFECGILELRVGGAEGE